jgi:hypothetical protein
MEALRIDGDLSSYERICLLLGLDVAKSTNMAELGDLDLLVLEPQTSLEDFLNCNQNNRPEILFENTHSPSYPG